MAAPKPGAVPCPGSRRAHAPVRFYATVLVMLGLLVGAVWFVVVVRQHKPETPPPEFAADDPRVQYTGPFKNVHPSVAYVGDEQCADCHQDQTAHFHRHAMGRSLLPIDQVAGEQVYDQAHHNPFDAMGSRFLVERRREEIHHRRTVLGENGEAVGELDFRVDYVMGSGTHGYSYLTNRDGYLFQTPISWFSQKQRWDKSPGFNPDMLAGRAVPGTCLFCHANRVRPVEGYANRYESPLFEGHAIGCERCHGPGALHVQNPGELDPQTNIDPTIVNPKHLPAELRAATCEQCHLEGESRNVRHGRGLFDFRPGLALQPFWSVFVRAPDSEEDYKAVNHVEQMYQSLCFLRSADDPRAGTRKMGCTSCHDPHQRVAEADRVPYYRQACLACHESHGCSVPEAERRLTNKEDSCIECHMRPYSSSDIAHTASTDHRILRRKDQVRKPDPARVGSGLPILPFYAGQWNADTKKVSRDHALALIKHARTGKAGSAREAGRAMGILEAALPADPEDVEAWEGKAEALMLSHDPRNALSAIETLLEKAPRRELALAAAAMICQNVSERELAIAYWRRAIEMNPWAPQYLANLSLLLEHKKAWDELRPECQAWLRLDPSSVEARRVWVACLLKEGKRDEARVEFAKIEQLNPPNLEKLKSWFEERSGTR